MNEKKQIRQPDRPLSSSSGNAEIPVETVLVDRQGRILFASGNVLEKKNHPAPAGVTTTYLASILESHLSPEDFLELSCILEDMKTPRFSRCCRTTGLPTRHIVVTGAFCPAGTAEQQWLLTFQDVSCYYGIARKLAMLESEMDSILRSQEKQLEEATSSLIETNVALRKEIRDRQNILEALRESETRFRDLTETTSDFIWEVDADGRYTYASPKSIKLLGVAPEQILGTLFLPWRQSSSPDTSWRATVIENTLRTSFYNVEYSYVRHDGRELTIESSGEPVFTKRNEFAGFRGIDRDVTERHSYEKELRMAKELAESANHAKSEFLANMSHELRTPLHAILSFTNYGVKRIETADRQELLRFFRQIAVSAKRLLPLINSLLDLAKLEAGKMNYVFQHVDLFAEIRSVIHEIVPLAEKKGLTIEIIPPDISTQAFFDQGRIGQVIRNILSNGVKFSDSGTTISIDFAHQVDIHNQTMLLTTISDQGVGIPADELAAIFDKFAQSSKTKTGAGGTGLGLAICKQIIEDHRGKIWASMGKDGATRFHFTLPVRARTEKMGQILINKGLVSREALEDALKEQ